MLSMVPSYAMLADLRISFFSRSVTVPYSADSALLVKINEVWINGFLSESRKMSSVLGIVGHRSRVRALYKAILRLHKGMPPELKEIGDKYVKEEFKRHKDAEAPFVVVFMKEWAVGH